MEVNVAAVTVSVVSELISLAGSVAAIVAAPGAMPSAKPLLPVTLLMEAILVSLELHVTEVVKSWVLASE